MPAMLNLLRHGSLLLLCLLTACSVVFDTDRHLGDAEPVAVSEFCTEFVDIGCTAQRDCCPEPDFDEETCLEEATEGCELLLGVLGLDSRAGYDPRVAGDALAEARDLMATCDPAFYSWVNSPLGLWRIFTGGVALGEPCDQNPFAPINAAMCVDDGVCRPAIRGVPLDYRCVAPVPLGGECFLDVECEPGLRCSVLVEGVLPGTCERRKEDGERCSRPSECATQRCANFTCRAATLDEAYCPG